jgi:Thiamine biosynthesis protein (ThiI)
VDAVFQGKGTHHSLASLSLVRYPQCSFLEHRRLQGLLPGERSKGSGCLLFGRKWACPSLAEPFRPERHFCGNQIGNWMKEATKAYQALALLSGGLDSPLVVKIMIGRMIAVTAVHFTSPFCNCTSRRAGCRQQAVKVAQKFGMPAKSLISFIRGRQ